MVNPVNGYGISTPYGKRGSYWSCDENSNGDGIHTGVDYACPSNTPLVAAIAGTIRHRNYGSAFGDRAFAISPSAGQPFEAGEVFYAHGNERLADGTEVQIGDYVGKSGARGNVSGPHLHFEYHPNAKNSWSCNVIADPAPVIAHGGGSSGGGGGGGSEYPIPNSGTVYVSKLTFGQEDSDSVWYLQDALNDHPLSGGATLPLTGGYFDMTDAEVIKCQTQHGFGADAPGTSFVGPSQAEHLFAGRSITVNYDTGNPSQPPPSGGSGGGDLPQAPTLLYPGAIWNPISGMSGLRPFAGSAKKITLHTTETSVKPNWEQQQSGTPHLTVDLEAFTVWQHLDFGIAAYTLTGGDNSPNSDSGVNIQIEMIGHAAETDDWDDTRYGNLREVLTWLSENLGIPYNFPVTFPPPNRLNWDQWYGLSGILGHSMVPYNDHSDPGSLDVTRLMDEEPPVDETVYVTLEEYEAGQAALDQLIRDIVVILDAYLGES